MAQRGSRGGAAERALELRGKAAGALAAVGAGRKLQRRHRDALLTIPDITVVRAL
jgi:hypothetical protein